MRSGTLKFLALLLLVSRVHAGDWRVTGDADCNKVTFHSEATLESFDGETHAIRGALSFPGTTIDSTSMANFSVDLLQLTTGIDLRDSHMRDNHLHTSKYPTTEYTVDRVLSGGELQDGVPLTIRVDGKFQLHGITRDLPLDVTLTWYADGQGTACSTPGPVLRMQAAWDVALADHEIPRPAFLFMKMAESVNMRLDAWAVPAP
ncbi:MAG: YceI family protein [Calditrichaeota bacterium]|nr:YceI family protein [Candidatus Cloacimonadota bacterium]MCA9786738.1 YceI family protein [Candidatus Cloacimonadota bacterium]MCB1045876.1 YceI family protein [Calditrichota bacterium]